MIPIFLSLSFLSLSFAYFILFLLSFYSQIEIVIQYIFHSFLNTVVPNVLDNLGSTDFIGICWCLWSKFGRSRFYKKILLRIKITSSSDSLVLFFLLESMDKLKKYKNFKFFPGIYPSNLKLSNLFQFKLTPFVLVKLGHIRSQHHVYPVIQNS